jgi:hypothetical protein
MEAEGNGLSYQLETEQSRFKKMQVDLQMEPLRRTPSLLLSWMEKL